MKSITSALEWEEALKSDKLILLITFGWSKRAASARATVESWLTENEKTLSGVNVCELDPDRQLHAWHWVSANAMTGADEDSASGMVLWVRSGSLVGRASNAAELGSAGLTQLTERYFSVEPGKSATQKPRWMEPWMLEILRCPESRQKLAIASDELVGRVNQKISVTGLQKRGGQLVHDKIDGALVRSDGRWLYPVRNNLPVLLVDEALPAS